MLWRREYRTASVTTVRAGQMGFLPTKKQRTRVVLVSRFLHQVLVLLKTKNRTGKSGCVCYEGRCSQYNPLFATAGTRGVRPVPDPSQRPGRILGHGEHPGGGRVRHVQRYREDAPQRLDQGQGDEL